MRKSVIDIGFAIGVFVPTSSAYANDNVAALLQQCNAEYASTDWFYCVGKVGGISDVTDLNGLLYSSGKGRTNLLRRTVLGCKHSRIGRKTIQRDGAIKIL
jgi:hypothetical protein